MMTAQIRVARTINAMNTFSDFLDGETESLLFMKAGVVQAGAEQKQALTSTVEEYLKSLLDDPDELSRATAESPELKQALTDGWARFSKAMAENIKALDRARKASQRVTEMIVEAARKAHYAQTGYAPMGTTSEGPTVISMSLDQKL